MNKFMLLATLFAGAALNAVVEMKGGNDAVKTISTELLDLATKTVKVKDEDDKEEKVTVTASMVKDLLNKNVTLFTNHETEEQTRAREEAKEKESKAIENEQEAKKKTALKEMKNAKAEAEAKKEFKFAYNSADMTALVYAINKDADVEAALKIFFEQEATTLVETGFVAHFGRHKFGYGFGFLGTLGLVAALVAYNKNRASQD